VRFRKNKESIVVWSNLLFFIPAIIAINQKLYLYSVIITIATVTSIAFHTHIKSVVWRWADHLTADILIISNLVLFYKSSFINLYFGSAILLAIVALTFYFRTSQKNYVFNHTAWHILSAAISIISVAGFMSY